MVVGSAESAVRPPCFGSGSVILITRAIGEGLQVSRRWRGLR